MKLFLFLVLSLALNKLYCQEFVYTDTSEIFDGYISIIDKSEETKNIFDYSNPFSLVSLVSKNQLYGIQTLDSNFFNQKKRIDSALTYSIVEVQLCDSLGWPKFLRDSIGRGIVKRDPGTGIEQEVLAPQAKYYFDFKEISRLIVYYDTVENQQTKEKKVEVVKMGFAKKYNNSTKYDVVFNLPYEFIRRLDAFKVLKKLDATEVEQIIKDTSSFYYKLNFLNRGTNLSIPKILKENDSLSLLEYKDSLNGLSSKEFEYLWTLPNLYFNDFERLSVINKTFLTKGTMHLKDQYYFPAYFNFGSYFDYDMIERIIKLNQCEYSKHMPAEGPIVYKRDGYVVVDTLFDISISYVYNDNPNIYLVYDFMYNDSLTNVQNNAYVESILITKDSQELGELVTLRYDLYKKANGKGRYGIDLKFDPYIDKYVIKNYTQTLPFFVELNKELKRNKRLNVNKDKVVEELSKEFNLYQKENHPQNLLGILPR